MIFSAYFHSAESVSNELSNWLNWEVESSQHRISLGFDSRRQYAFKIENALESMSFNFTHILDASCNCHVLRATLCAEPSSIIGYIMPRRKEAPYNDITVLLEAHCVKAEDL